MAARIAPAGAAGISASAAWRNASTCSDIVVPSRVGISKPNTRAVRGECNRLLQPRTGWNMRKNMNRRRTPVSRPPQVNLRLNPELIAQVRALTGPGALAVAVDEACRSGRCGGAAGSGSRCRCAGARAAAPAGDAAPQRLSAARSLNRTPLRSRHRKVLSPLVTLSKFPVGGDWPTSARLPWSALHNPASHTLSSNHL